MDSITQDYNAILDTVLKRYDSGLHPIPSSVQVVDGVVYAMANNASRKMMVVYALEDDFIPEGFEPDVVVHGDGTLTLIPLTPANAIALRQTFRWTAPVLLGKSSSFGFGDRLGNASVAHLRSLENSAFRPIVAQQSIREMDRTRRTPQEVMDCATWAVFEAGFTSGFGSDADHLKTTAHIDRTMEAGFTMFTIDPSDHVDYRAPEMSLAELKQAFGELPWSELDDTPEDFLSRYRNVSFQLGGDLTLQPSEEQVLRAAVKYGRVVAHTRSMWTHLKTRYADRPSEIELSVDETPHPTTPEEHLLVAAELQRLGVELVSLAPRFCGDFEKGIDFKGDMQAFREEYRLHQAIAGRYGGYKLSIHSGSDKFQVYAAIGELNIGSVHVKTAGTSYLEALRAVAMTNPDLFRELITFSAERFETDRKTYHISARLEALPHEQGLTDEALPDLLNDDNARQVFHVTFGSVLTAEDDQQQRVFYPRFMQTLWEHAEVYEHCLYTHFRKHLAPFEYFPRSRT